MKKLTGSTRLKVGDKIKFNIGDKIYNEVVKEVLFPGTPQEEVIYDKKRNHYFITAMVLQDQSQTKNVTYEIKEHGLAERLILEFHELTKQIAKIKEDSYKLNCLTPTRDFFSKTCINLIFEDHKGGGYSKPFNECIEDCDPCKACLSILSKANERKKLNRKLGHVKNKMHNHAKRLLK